ncbi:MAG TPA: hypothetical protein VKU62_07885, partial [Thermoanaerobaculia bacterium]|nr:hypothetical protein [Thermoanaerobaculia bacterium]
PCPCWGGAPPPPPGFRSCTVQTALLLLRNALLELHLPGPAANGLLPKIDAALASAGRGNNTAACNQLGAFVNEVHAQAGKNLTAKQADGLINGAKTARGILGCK